MLMCRHVRSTFDKAVEDFKASNAVKAMNIDSQESDSEESEWNSYISIIVFDIFV